jgi:hypothetical protein
LSDSALDQGLVTGAFRGYLASSRRQLSLELTGKLKELVAPRKFLQSLGDQLPCRHEIPSSASDPHPQQSYLGAGEGAVIRHLIKKAGVRSACQLINQDLVPGPEVRGALPAAVVAR